MSALGQKQTFGSRKRDVRFTPESGHGSARRQGPLCANRDISQSHFYHSSAIAAGNVPEAALSGSEALSQNIHQARSS